MGVGEMAPSSHTAVRGAAWATVGTWTQQGFGLVTFVVVGALIGPHLYGVMAMGMLYHLLAASLIRDTFGESLIQRHKLKRLHFDTVFWMQLALGTVLLVASALLASPIATLFGEPQLAPVIAWLGLTFPMLALSSFYRCVLRRDMNFKALAIRSLVACSISSVVAIALALMGFGLWSLVIYQLVYHALELAAVAFQSGWRPRLVFSVRCYGELADFSYKTIGNSLLANFGSQIDRFLVGYFVGAGALGLYSMARRIVEALDQTSIGVIGSIGLPAFSRIQGERGAVKQLLYGATHFAMLISCPVYAGLALVADQLIAVALPEAWSGTGPVLAVMCMSGLFFSAMAFLASCQRAVGQAGLVLVLGIVQMLLRVLLGFVAVLLGYGAMGIVVAIAISSVIMVPVRIMLAQRGMWMDPLSYVATMGAPIAATAVMTAAVLGTEFALAREFSDIVVLLAMIAAGVVSYVGALAVLSKRSLEQILAVFQRNSAASVQAPAPSASEPIDR